MRRKVRLRVALCILAVMLILTLGIYASERGQESYTENKLHYDYGDRLHVLLHNFGVKQEDVDCCSGTANHEELPLAISEAPLFFTDLGELLERTFGIVMLVPTPDNMVQMRSAKNDCTAMTGCEFLCPGSGCWENPPHGAPCGHHSCWNHMLRHVIPTPASPINSGLHMMYFAGHVCGYFGGAHQTAIGVATHSGNRSIVSTSSEYPLHTTWYTTRIVQHEWSHNYYVTHGECLTTCVMYNFGWFYVKQDVYNVWCNVCRNILQLNRDRHSG